MDWLTGALTVLAMELIGRKRWEGWVVGLVNQGFWLWLVVTREMWGLLPLTAILTWRYAMALRRWRRAPVSGAGARPGGTRGTPTGGGRE